MLPSRGGCRSAQMLRGVEAATHELQQCGWGGAGIVDADTAKYAAAAEHTALSVAQAATKAAEAEVAHLRSALAAERSARRLVEVRAATLSEATTEAEHLIRNTPSNGSTAEHPKLDGEDAEAMCAQVARQVKLEADRSVRVATAAAASAVAKAERDAREAAQAAQADAAEARQESAALRQQLDTVREAAAVTCAEQEAEICELREQLGGASGAIDRPLLTPAPPARDAATPSSAYPSRATPASAASVYAEEERAVQTEALERAMAALEEERLELTRTAHSAARREARRAETAELVAQELAELQAIVMNSEPPGPALLRISRERRAALEQVSELRTELVRAQEDGEFQRRLAERAQRRADENDRRWRGLGM